MITPKTVEVIVTDKQFRRFLFATGGCRKCGSGNNLIRYSISGVYLHCHKCGANTKAYPSLDLAIDEWNGCKDPLFSKNEGE